MTMFIIFAVVSSLLYGGYRMTRQEPQGNAEPLDDGDWDFVDDGKSIFGTDED